MAVSKTRLIDDANMQVPSRYAKGPPHADWKVLRSECPVYFCEPEGYRPFWAVTKYNDILEVEKRADVFLNEPRSMVMPIDFENYLNEKFGSVNGLMKMLVQMDGTEHMKHRMLIQPWLTPKALRDRQKDVEAICDMFFDRLQAKGPEGEVDMARDLIYRYPLRVVCGLLGLPEEEDEIVLQMNENMSKFERPPEGVDEVSGFEQLLNYFGAVVEDRKKNPKDDLSTFIANMKLDGQDLEPREQLAYFVIFGSAGHDTTASSLSGGLKVLLEHPEQLEMLRKDRSLLPGAINEILRYVSPVNQFCREAAEDYELNGQLIRKGESVVVYYPSGNRDEDIYEDPDTFNILRPPSRHLAFGSGPHTCLGNHLAPMEMRRFFTDLLDRFEYLELAGPAPYVPTHLVSRMEKLPVKYRFNN